MFENKLWNWNRQNETQQRSAVTCFSGATITLQLLYKLVTVNLRYSLWTQLDAISFMQQIVCKLGFSSQGSAIWTQEWDKYFSGLNYVTYNGGWNSYKHARRNLYIVTLKVVKLFSKKKYNLAKTKVVKLTRLYKNHKSHLLLSIHFCLP